MKKINIYQVAKTAGVSIATVSRVINDSARVRPVTREKVEAALKSLKYTPNAIARSLVTHSTDTIGVLVTDVRDSYYAGAVYTIERACRNVGMQVIECNTGGELDEKVEYIRLLLSKRVDAIVLVGSVFREETTNSHIIEAAKSVPIVMLNSILDGDNIYSIRCDEGDAVRRVLLNQIVAGRRHPVFICDVISYSSRSKVDGFKAGLQSEGIPFDEDMIIHVDRGVKGGHQGLRYIIDNDIPCDLIICTEDLVAAGVVKEAAKSGITIPGDTAVFGFNNSIVTQCTTPELSSVDSRIDDMAKIAVDIIKNVLSGKAVDKCTMVKADLVYRESALEK